MFIQSELTLHSMWRSVFGFGKIYKQLTSPSSYHLSGYLEVILPEKSLCRTAKLVHWKVVNKITTLKKSFNLEK